MLKKIAPPTEYIAPSVEVLEMVVEQPVFQVSNAEGMTEEEILDLLFNL